MTDWRNKDQRRRAACFVNGEKSRENINMYCNIISKLNIFQFCCIVNFKGTYYCLAESLLTPTNAKLSPATGEFSQALAGKFFYQIINFCSCVKGTIYCFTLGTRWDMKIDNRRENKILLSYAGTGKLKREMNLKKHASLEYKIFLKLNITSAYTFLKCQNA